MALLVTVAYLAVAVLPAAAQTSPSPSLPIVETAQLPPVAPDLAPILERAGAYALDYETKFQNVAADEAYTQFVRGLGETPTITRSVEGPVPEKPLTVLCLGSKWCRRVTMADVVFVRPEGARAWKRFRDVHEADGLPVRPREPRLEQLFSSRPFAGAEARARGLQEDSDTRFNIGPALRDLASPTLALTFLHPDNQPRFRWQRKGRRRVGAVESVEVEFEEVARPTLLTESSSEPLPARGRVWLDRERGSLVHSEMEFRFTPQGARATVEVEFRFEPALGVWAPVAVRERYEDEKGGQPMFGRPTRATAQLSGFRRFQGAAASEAARGAATGPAAGTLASSGPEPRAAAAHAAELAQLLQRAGEYVTEYESKFSDLVVEETYKQSLTPRVKLDRNGGTVIVGACSPCKQTTRAELVFVRLAGEFPWASYRDVFEVDGHKLREQDQRLVQLLSKPSADADEQAGKLLAASAVYNIGPVKRTVNLPTLPLMFLLPRNQSRFVFTLGAHQTIASTETVELAFRETERPTLVKGPRGSDLGAKGRFWINPARGTVVRSEVEFEFGPEAKARVTVDYRPEPALAMWVPTQMEEEYADVDGAKLRTFPVPFKSVARYAKFRRFTVRSEEGQAVLQP